MLAISAAIVVVALLAWDVARREIGRRASEPEIKAINGLLDAHSEAIAKLEERFASLTERVDKQDAAIVNGVQEMRGLLAPVRGAILKAVRDK